MWFAWTGGLGYFGMVVIYSAELILISITSIPLYRTRGVGAHIFDQIKIVAILGLFLLFNLIGYNIANNNAERDHNRDVFDTFFNLDSHTIGIALGYAIVRVLAAFVVAIFSPNPRLEWSRITLLGGAVTVLTLFLMSFVVFAGAALVSIVSLLFKHVAVDEILMTLFLMIHFGLSLVIAKMPQKKLLEISKDPYFKQ